MENKIGLYQLNCSIKNALLDAFPETVWITAEISQLTHHRNGHCYLELIEKDKHSDKIIAKARATIWARTYYMVRSYFESITGRKLDVGLKIMVSVSVEFHELYSFSLNIKDIDPDYTIGDLARQKQAIINKLKAEGTFELNKELPLPSPLQRIAIISSSGAAGYGDFINQLQNNQYGYNVHYQLFEAYMQGNKAEESIVNALVQIFEQEDNFDAVVIIRGGGAKSELSCFDNYAIASHIAQFPLPVLSGIGHQRDDTIVDMVAHTRLKTPTAVAEFIISQMADFEEYIEHFAEKAQQVVTDYIQNQKNYLEMVSTNLKPLIKHKIHHLNEKLNYFDEYYPKKMGQFFKNKKQHLENLNTKLKPAVKNKLANEKNQLNFYREKALFSTRKMLQNQHKKLNSQIESLQKNLDYKFHFEHLKNKEKQTPIGIVLSNYLKKENEKLNKYSLIINHLDPINVVKKGYTITTKNGKIVQSINELNEGEIIQTYFKDGKIQSKITKNKT